MQKKFLIGVDLGTSSTKAALYQVNGKILSQSSADVPLINPSPGLVEQRNEDFLNSAALTVSNCIQQAGVNPKDIAAIAFDSQMAGVGLMDENFRPVANFDSWLDMRCQPYIELMDRDAGNEVTLLTGCPPTCDHGPKMLWWKHERPEVYRRTAKFVMPGSYVAAQLAELPIDQSFIDHTYIHFSGFSDGKQGGWSKALCEKFGLEMDKLPKIVDPCHVVGVVNGKQAKKFGLAAGTLIAAGAGDTAANALGAGIVKPGMLFDVAGTAAVLAGCTERFIADTQHRALLTMRSVIPGLWHPLAYIGGGGIALRWFRDNFFKARQDESLADPTDDLYARMIERAKKIPAGSDGLFFSPHLGGRICPSNPEMRGAWIGFSWSHSQDHFARAVLESVAFEYAYYLKILKQYIPDLQLVEARVVGGGARSNTWNQIKADVLNIPYQRLKGNEFGTWGAAMIAGKAAGLIENLAEHAENTAILNGKKQIPSNTNRGIYQPLVDKYIEMQNLLNGYFKVNA